MLKLTTNPRSLLLFFSLTKTIENQNVFVISLFSFFQHAQELAQPKSSAKSSTALIWHPFCQQQCKFQNWLLIAQVLKQIWALKQYIAFMIVLFQIKT